MTVKVFGKAGRGEVVPQGGGVAVKDVYLEGTVGAKVYPQ